MTSVSALRISPRKKPSMTKARAKYPSVIKIQMPPDDADPADPETWRTDKQNEVAPHQP